MGGDADADPAADMGMGGDDEPADDFERAAKDATDPSLPPKEQWAALKEAIHICFEEYESKPHEEAGSSGAEKKGSGLLLALGLPKGGKKG